MFMFCTGIYFDVPEITPDAVGIFRFDSNNDKVKTTYYSVVSFTMLSSELQCLCTCMKVSSLAMAMRPHNTCSHTVTLWLEAFFDGWVALSANFRRKGRRPPTTIGVRKLE